MQRVVDLTFPIAEGMTTFPVAWHPYVEITQLGRHGIEGRETRKVILGTHTGTHCDAPRHFIPGGATIDTIDPALLVGPAVVLDLSHLPASSAVTTRDLESPLAGRTPERLVLRFGWDSRWGTHGYYAGHPYLADDTARWLVAQGVRLLGMDTPMPDNPLNGARSTNDSPVHKILLGAGVILVEYLCNLAAIERDEVDLIVAPLPIASGDGAPARVFAVQRFQP